MADRLENTRIPLYARRSQRRRSTPWGMDCGVFLTVQVYFDFSGYSDMAIGLARMFGVLLPLNFHSPLRAASIIDYWRRWHMTLTRSMVSYLSSRYL